MLYKNRLPVVVLWWFCITTICRRVEIKNCDRKILKKRPGVTVVVEKLSKRWQGKLKCSLAAA